MSQPETRQSIQRASIDDLQSAEAAESLSVRQLKEILVNNFVDYRGCCEKHELVDRVKRLWVETQANRQIGESSKCCVLSLMKTHLGSGWKRRLTGSWVRAASTVFLSLMKVHLSFGWKHRPTGS